ncbi:hypothetical protein [Chitinophaga sp. S165]|uniref:hypothetical protein n=1 Tax=Chitinophaga sp. S165 TaxID=2135462 RepID=UPI000D717864|nr:hypothetical protein [Chitinophaga sp. S165]PWV45923.1 hypothetical protein C7475_112141 [Chitinophaga sp. S165]
MFTTDNYFDRIKVVSINSLPALLQESHQFIVKATKNGTSWAGYQSSQAIKEAIDLHLEQMQQYEAKQRVATAKGATPKPNKEKKTKADSLKQKAAKEDNNTAPLMVSRIPDELRFIRRFLNMHEKTQVKEQILRFINALQKAIVEKRIRKTSQWAEQITYIQNRLIETHNTMKDKITIILTPETREQFKQSVTGEKLLSSVGFIKRYIGLHQKAGVKDKATALLAQIDRAYNKGSLTNSDPYTSHMLTIQQNLQNFIADRNTKVLSIEPAILFGLQGILSGLDGCACGNHSLNGLDEVPEVISSVDFVQKEFPTIGFTGKWRDFIGDPSPGFTAMVSARPKFGKSTLCADFAGYLARSHGPVLFVAKEEGFSKTLRDKLERVRHPRLMVASSLPADLSSFQYIFLDSVTRLGLTPDDLRRLKATNAGKSFIYIFQVTKGGQFRGANDFQHDVDVVIELPQPGKAIQFGRYNQGGELDVFDDNYAQAM